MCACLPSPKLVWNWYMYVPQVVESTYRNVVPIIYQLSASSWRSFVCACMQDAESICLLLYSENGKTSNDSKLRAYCLREAIQWKFNLEASPWWGKACKLYAYSNRRSLKFKIIASRMSVMNIFAINYWKENSLNAACSSENQRAGNARLENERLDQFWDKGDQST